MKKHYLKQALAYAGLKKAPMALADATKTSFGFTRFNYTSVVFDVDEVASVPAVVYGRPPRPPTSKKRKRRDNQ